MSTEHQQYSTENQLDAIKKYAAQRDMTLVHIYEDAGKSGLRLSGREALQQLLASVDDNTADYGVILVYDVTRWGRFLDADESAYYEYICKKHKRGSLLHSGCRKIWYAGASFGPTCGGGL
jgi:DNA invertase Pin-like site-specific DNA recombinase